MQAKSCLPGVVVQLVRIPACHAGGRGFESRPLRQSSVFAVLLGAKAFLRRKPKKFGGIAQLGERLHGMQEVIGSIPFTSTKFVCVISVSSKVLTPSSRGLGHHPFTVSTGVRIPVGSPKFAARHLRHKWLALGSQERTPSTRSGSSVG